LDAVTAARADPNGKEYYSFSNWKKKSSIGLPGNINTDDDQFLNA